jgi:hypothetical protein
MRVLFSVAVGLLIGFAFATWFFHYGGNIIVAGRELGPPGGGRTPTVGGTGTLPPATIRPDEKSAAGDETVVIKMPRW